MFSHPAVAERVLNNLIARESDPQLETMLRHILDVRNNPAAEPGRYNSRFSAEIQSYWQQR